MRKKDITYQEKLNELRLDLSHPNNKKQVFILVEGDSDIRLFRKFFKSNISNVERIPGGKGKLEECVTLLINQHHLLVGVRDADFIHLNGSQYTIANMFLTDFHDMEMTMLKDDATLSSLIFEYTNLDRTKHGELRDKVLEAISSIGYFKWLNEVEGLGLCFECGFQDLIDLKNNEIDLIQYIQRVLGKSENPRISDPEVIRKEVNQLKLKKVDLMQLTNGHDLLNALSRYFRDKYGRDGINEKILSSSSRVAYSTDSFKQTLLYSQLVDWAQNNGVVIFE